MYLLNSSIKCWKVLENGKKILEKLGKFVSPKMWEPWYIIFVLLKCLKITQYLMLVWLGANFWCSKQTWTAKKLLRWYSFTLGIRRFIRELEIDGKLYELCLRQQYLTQNLQEDPQLQHEGKMIKHKSNTWNTFYLPRMRKR